MFTFIRNYKTLFMMGVMSNMAEKLTPAIDTDGDAYFDMSDFNEFNAETQAAIRRVLQDANMSKIEEGKRFSMESLIKAGFVVERNATIDATADTQRGHREEVDNAVLSKAVNYIDNKMTQANREALSRALLGEVGTSEDLAKAVILFQKEHGLTPDGQPGRNTVTKYNELVEAGEFRRPGLSAREQRQADRAAAREARRVEREARRAARAEGNEAHEEIKFTRTLRKGMKGEDVATLQKLLTERGYDARYKGEYDGSFGNGTRKALQRYQREVLGQSGDGVMSLNGATMNSLIGASDTARTAGLSEGGAEVVEDLRTIERYLTAYNDTYGEQGKLLSNKMGLLGIASQIGNSDANALARELGISQNDVRKFGKSLGIPTGPNVLPGIKRFAVIAALSLLTTGGAAVAIELLGINTSTKLHRGPHTSKILTALGRDGGFDARYRRMLLDKNTTAGDIAATFDVLNNEPMIPANLKREINDVFGRNFLSFIGDIFGAGGDFRQAEGLIEQFINTNDVHDGEIILRQLYELSVQELREQRERLTGLQSRPRHYHDDDRGGNTTEDQIRSTTRRINKMETALVGIQRALSKIVNLSDRRDVITGTSRATERRSSTATYEAMLGEGRTLRSIPKSQLESSGAYSIALPKPPTQAAMVQRLELIQNSKVAGDRYSIQSHIMRGINEHHGITFSQAEFEQAFVQMRTLSSQEQEVINQIVLSNTGRHLSQKFQGEVSSGNITVMTINGTNIYFRGECSNILTIAHPLDTTIQSARSIPLAVPIGLTSGGSDVTTTPVDDDVITTPIDTGVITVPTIPVSPIG